MFRIHFHKSADRVIAQGVAGRPVGNIRIHPFFKYRKIGWLKVFADKIGKVAGDKRLFHIARLPQFFAQGKYRLFIHGKNFLIKRFANPGDNSCLNPVNFHVFLKKILPCGRGMRVAVLSEFLTDLLDDSIHG